MSGVTKLGLALVLVFALALLALSAELLYVLFYRRRFRRAASAADTELSVGGSEGGPASKELLLYFLCWKNQSRVEPAGAAAEAPPPAKPSPSGAGADEGDELARWRAVCYGPSRVLYTIKEEEEREAAESDVARGRGRSPEAETEEEETPFSTPCASPPFYTPASSPPRTVPPRAGEAEPLSLVEEHV